MKTYKIETDGSRYNTTSMFKMIELEERCKNPVGSHIHKRTYDKTDTTSSESVMVAHESVGPGLNDEGTEERGGADEVNVGAVEYIARHRDRKNDVVL